LSIVSCVRLISLVSLLATAPAAAADNPLADHVRANNDRFKDVKVALAKGYAPIEPDVTADGYRVMARFQPIDWDLLVQATPAKVLSRASHCEPRKAEPHTD
jgi:hypothetical protein